MPCTSRGTTAPTSRGCTRKSGASFTPRTPSPASRRSGWRAEPSRRAPEGAPMITLVTLHIVNEAHREEALWLLRRNTELASQAKGFVSRSVLFSKKNPSKGYSITTWESEEDMDRYLKSEERQPREYEGEETRVYLKTPTGRVLLFIRTDSERCESLPVS